MKKILPSFLMRKPKVDLQNAIKGPQEAYAKQRYNTPLFITHEILGAFQRHNVLGLSAALSFYTLFALIPLTLLLFFLLSQLVFSSDYAIVKLAIVTANLVPQLSRAIMLEVYNTAQHKAVWGFAGILVLLWAVTPLASALRTAFYHIAALAEAPSFVRRKIKDIIAVVGILLLLFSFTFAGLIVEKVITFIGENTPLLQYGLINHLATLCLTTLLLFAFYVAFFPVRLNNQHIILGALFTTILWLLMRPAFNLFLSVQGSIGSLFGSMTHIFVSIAWLYFNFAAFLLGTELIATLRKQDVLLLKGLFNGTIQNKPHYLHRLMQRYGHTYQRGEYILRQGNMAQNLYYLVQGQVHLLQQGKILRHVEAGHYFGEMALLSNLPTIADAVVTSEQAEIILISPDTIETLLLDEPKVAMKFLRQLATRLQLRDGQI